jgi:uncharacterized protein with PIN domain
MGGVVRFCVYRSKIMGNAFQLRLTVNNDEDFMRCVKCNKHIMFRSKEVNIIRIRESLRSGLFLFAEATILI